MSKMKELDFIAQGVADHMKELLYDTVEWQISDQPVDGDDFNELHSYVMKKAVENMFFSVFKGVTFGENIKITNKIQSLLDNINE